MIDRTDAEATDGWLSPETWNAIQRSMPICCVDFFPVELDPATGEVLRVGLISRPFPDPDRTTHVWCQVGGRVRFGETLRAGLIRHAYDTFTYDSEADAAAAIDFDVLRYPVVSEWFPPRLGLAHDQPAPIHPFGSDPRKHAVSTCYAATMPTGVSLRPGSADEASAFKWFDVDELSTIDMWPGSFSLVQRVIEAIDRRPIGNRP
ncbi:hypothetical protein GOPIP_067_00430 [Gordonia polyisoprenivorans NBRC 16320 = JCM 10675]|uniref:DUF4916 domain-containing protein n=1 Tax=Gordonia polyisoprenivorans TaxID=84595 RepID=A0A846WHM9_9ACTN|nr:DUF4916 domain-containing protein [Gordonia polyisoprenivorans]NKY00413.1 DUF4916 domain-containing protein [Gordonia polyisoprenivorans]GAB24401.1 hypothetical protein GOPIP_067_00430 [Gordonia polyisoprenivorans NBRC 16320 = JCM 10675]